MTTVHGTCTAFALNVLMVVSGFYHFTAELALNGIFDFFLIISPKMKIIKDYLLLIAQAHSK